MIALGLLRALGLRGTVILVCLLVLAVTAYGVAQDLGLLETPAHAAAAPKSTAGQPRPSSAAVADIPAGYLRLYRQADARYRIPWRCWPRSARSSPTTAGSGSPACVREVTGPGRVGPCRSAVSRAARPATAGLATATADPTIPPRPSRPRPGIWSTTAPAATLTGPSLPTTTPGPMSPG